MGWILRGRQSGSRIEAPRQIIGRIVKAGFAQQRGGTAQQAEPGSLLSAVVTVLSGSVVGQGLVVLLSPVVARLYGPADFGVLSVYSSSLSLALVVAGLRYELAIPIADTKGRALILAYLSLASVLFFSVLSLLGLVVLHVFLGGRVHSVWLPRTLWLLPVGIVAGGTYQTLSFWATRQRAFAAVARTRVSQGASGVAVQLLLGILHTGAWGLVAADTVGRGAGTLTLWRQSRRQLVAARVTLRRCASTARAYARYPLTMMTAGLLNAGAMQAPLLTMPALFGTAAAGSYFFAFRLLVLPASLVGAAVSQVLFGEAAHFRADSSALRETAERVTRALVVANTPLYLVVFAAGEPAFHVLFGSRWAEAGIDARILAPFLCLWSVASPLSALLIVGDRLRESLLYTALDLLLKVVSIGAGWMLGSPRISVLLLAVTGVLLVLVSLHRFLGVAGLGLRHVFRPLIHVTALAAPFVAAAAWAAPRVTGVFVIVLLGLTLAISWLLGYWYCIRRGEVA
jgi:O-antigen/teichoic acid export membrane protein